MHPMTSQYVIWLACIVLQAAIAVFAVRQKISKTFPLFFHYTIFQAVSSVFLLGVERLYYDQYFYAFWAITAVRIGFSFLVIHEVFVYAVRPYAGLKDLTNLVFRWAALLMGVVSLVVALSTTGNITTSAIGAIVALERSIRLMQCGMLMFILLSSNYLGIQWRNIGNGIALGFGLFATADLIAASAMAHLGMNWAIVFSFIRSGMYLVSVLIWLGYVVAPQPARERVEGVYRPIIDRWNQAALAVMDKRGPVAVNHTYLSDIERAVENVLAKSGQ